MKKLTYLLSALGMSAATALTLSACRDYDIMDEEKAAQINKLEEFSKNFVAEFGTPDPNHTWGWGMTPEMADKLLGSTRAATRGDDPYQYGGAINTNVNQWTENNANSLKNVIHVPGWPAEDGRYYVKTGTYATSGTYNRYSSDAEGTGKGNAMGDVTEYEIQWVSQYVRTHTYGQLKDKHEALIHMSEFFIQQVSTDYDYNADGSVRTYGGSTQYSQYQMDKLDFQSISGAWTHINNFNAYMNLAPQANIGKNDDRNIMYVMSSGTENFQYHPSTATNSWLSDKFILLEFTWEEPRDPNWSLVTNGTYSLDQVLANPKLLDTNTVTRTGYYLCFDYQSQKKTEEGWEYAGDDIYSNWILKLTPGRYKQNERWPKRLMCEDLGNTFDFDFNDAVFDLIFQPNVNKSGWYDCVVVIQAAGGTMPIWVGIEPNTWETSEIHDLLGKNSTSTPVNVIKDGKKAPSASYRVKEMFSTTEKTPTFGKDTDGNTIIVEYPQPSDMLLQQMAAAAFRLKIYIDNPAEGRQEVSGEKIFTSLRNGSSETNPQYQNGYNDGIKSTNFAPQIFNCSTDAKWTYENGHIKDAYSHFVDWVHNEQGEYRLRWDKDVYYERNTGENTGTVVLINHDDAEKTSWQGSWDFGQKNSSVWGSDWIDKSKCYGGNGPE